MDTHRLRQLLDQRDAIDADIAAIVNGNGNGSVKAKERKPVTCSICGAATHTARNCPDKNKEATNGSTTVA